MVARGGIDLVLMDVKMPVMDGLEATRHLKETNPDLPIIALTANVFDSDRDAAMAVGCDDFLAKPVNSKLCLESIGNHLTTDAKP